VASLGGEQGKAQNDVGGFIRQNMEAPCFSSSLVSLDHDNYPTAQKRMKRQMRRRIVREHSAQFVWLELRLASKERAKREKAKMAARLTASLSKDSDDEVQQRNPCNP
jgi:hypothetical protein